MTMTVKELINELKQCQNQDAPVFIFRDADIFEIDMVDDTLSGSRVDINMKEES